MTIMLKIVNLFIALLLNAILMAQAMSPYDISTAHNR